VGKSQADAIASLRSQRLDFPGLRKYSDRMKKALLLVMVLVLASAAFAQSPNWFKGTLDEAIAKAKADRKLVLVDFYSYT
jgi:hypothetical protein